MQERESKGAEHVAENERIVADRLRDLLHGIGTLTLSTSRNDVPWAASGFFAEDGLFTLAMILESHGTTMTNIRSNPLVGISINGGNAFAPFAQAAADVDVVQGAAEIQAVEERLRAKVPEIGALLTIPHETVLLRVRTWRVTDFPSGWLPGKVLRAPEESAA